MDDKGSKENTSGDMLLRPRLIRESKLETETEDLAPAGRMKADVEPEHVTSPTYSSMVCDEKSPVSGGRGGRAYRGTLPYVERNDAED